MLYLKIFRAGEFNIGILVITSLESRDANLGFNHDGMKFHSSPNFVTKVSKEDTVGVNYPTITFFSTFVSEDVFVLVHFKIEMSVLRLRIKLRCKEVAELVLKMDSSNKDTPIWIIKTFVRVSESISDTEVTLYKAPTEEEAVEMYVKDDTLSGRRNNLSSLLDSRNGMLFSDLYPKLGERFDRLEDYGDDENYNRFVNKHKKKIVKFLLEDATKEAFVVKRAEFGQSY